MSPATAFEDYHEIYMLVNITEYHLYCLRVHGVDDNHTIDEVDSGTGGCGKAQKHAQLNFFSKNICNRIQCSDNDPWWWYQTQTQHQQIVHIKVIALPKTKQCCGLFALQFDVDRI